ncbi:MAG: DNA-directed RNA polymerase subunit alpha C-terminal domain-containing protein, partial [Eubacteriales bacterium]|nr:DNA-directed RNA polymerase subunit alpha C-terminal domain-containing protein [Eubacteriales bacterium]
MSESIFTLYSDERFEKILYYLKERGVITFNALMRFDFNELLFVPGVTESLIVEAKQLFSLHKTCPVIASEDPNITESPCELAAYESSSKIDLEEIPINVNPFDRTPQQGDNIKDVLLSDTSENIDSLKTPNLKSLSSLHFVKQIDYFPLSNRAKNCLKHTSISSLEELLSTTEEDLMRIRNMGRKTCQEILDFCSNIFCLEVGDTFSHLESELSSLNQVGFSTLSNRAKNCLKLAGISSLEELQSLAEEDLLTIKNLGVKTRQEILNYRETAISPSVDPTKLYYLENIAPENRPIPISLLHNIGMSEQGLDLFLRNNLFTVGYLCDRGLTPQEYSFARMINDYFSIPITKHFTDAVEALKDSAKISISKRCSGATLEEIGKELQVTRERVRQILAKTCRKLTGIAELVAGVLLSLDKAAFSFSDLINLFRSEESAMCCKLVLQESEYVRYIKFSDSFIKADVCGADIEDRLKEYTDEIISEGINFYDNLELIESELEKHSLGYFDALDIMNFLIHNKYRFYGDYVTKGTQPYAIVCHDAVRKFFRFDIKLDSDEDNADMHTLRQIIAKHYQGVHLPPNNRALTAGMTRDPSKLILSGRGRYCPIEKVIYSVSLFEELHSFITNSPQTSFYYSELFSHFQGRFLAETNIDNPNFLHGMLKCLYPNEFTYERDLMSKVGEPRQDIDDRLSQLLLENGRAMTKAEIKHAIPGINDFVILFSVMRLPEVIQWDYNEFNHIDNINITHEERAMLLASIKAQTDLHNGYSSDALLFTAVKG